MTQDNNQDDRFDAITAVVLIGVVVAGLVFWLYGLPS
jgi:hypothetical protein